MMADSAASPPGRELVWVMEGKTQHAAFVIDDPTASQSASLSCDTTYSSSNPEEKDGQDRVLVEWASTRTQDWVPRHSVEWSLTPRKRKRLLEERNNNPSLDNEQRDSNDNGRASSRNSSLALVAKSYHLDHNITKGGASRVSLLETEGVLPMTPVGTVDGTTKHVVASPTRKHEESKVGDDDDDEVEFLWTLAPTPPRNDRRPNSMVSSTTTGNPYCTSSSNNDDKDSDAGGSERRTHTTHEEDEQTSEAQSASEVSQVESQTQQQQQQDSKSSVTTPLAAAVTSTSIESKPNEKQSPRPPFWGSDSAYVQTLAEICYTILNDGRWRVGGLNQKCLVQWETGDDLSAIVALSRAYKPPLRQVQPIRRPCTCLLCHDSKEAGDDETRKQEASGMATSNLDGRSTFQDEEPSAQGLEEPRALTALHLYCRLFYRRGPWFRLDDIYDRYYKPDAMGTTKAPLPAGTADNNANKKPPVRYDASLLPKYMGRFNAMLQDLAHLLSCGLMRSFQGEEECGLTVGRCLLTKDLRATLLTKLGASKTKKAATKKPPPGDDYMDSRRPRRRQADVTNLVWKQMNMQQSLSFFGAGDNTGKTQKRRLLPVVKHVDELLVGKLSLDILRCCCGMVGNDNMTYLPSSIRKAYLPKIQQQLRQVVMQHLQKEPSLGAGKSAINSFTCWRLREEPTLTLRRCCRLYLCATGGPGEMRSSETNGWKTVLLNPEGHNKRLPLGYRVTAPFVSTWSSVTFDGSMVRFGLKSALFQNSYQPYNILYHSGDSADQPLAGELTELQTFSSLPSFWAWELCVELRANVDYLIELHELLRYEKRQKERRRKSRDDSQSEDNDVDDDDEEESVDFMRILTTEGIRSIIVTLAKTFATGSECVRLIEEQTTKRIREELSSCQTLTECERILISLAICSIYLLDARSQCIEIAESSSMVSRPWLRHLWWEGCLAYMLWDFIPIIERREMYSLAIEALRVLLYGGIAAEENQNLAEKSNPLAPLLLSRRARGKALDRLVIDKTHLNRHRINEMEAAAPPPSKAKGKGKSNKSLKKQASIEATEEIGRFSERVLSQVVHSSLIAFSSIRGLARRLKRPLSKVLQNMFCLEAQELGLRLENDKIEELESPREDEKVEGYKDWIPITDKAIANALDTDKDGAGSRCVFVGNDDSPSINVEQLAMECYEAGKLPVLNAVSDDSLVGGWQGWHDEGGFMRTIFRILCSAPLLGADWGCSCLCPHAPTLFCSPYQGAPFDLHVGFGLTMTDRNSAIPGFYFRERQRIESFLTKLAETSRQGLCDGVHRAVQARLVFALDNDRKDPWLDRDLKNLRTLSLIAAGFGGTLLAAAFRCMFFDYRHYSGGLPDLLLIRAIATKDGKQELVDLSSFVGETFSVEYQQEQQNIRGAKMLADEEFLGCSKVGDSGNSGGRFTRSMRRPQSHSDPKPPLSLADMPQQLRLFFNEEQIEPECMMVEVKSSNDRLDARQEDWLNVLDRYGNARVCKFEDKRKSSKRKLAQAA